MGKQEYIDSNKLIKTVKSLKGYGHPDYKDIAVDDNFLNKCKGSDKETFKFSQENSSDSPQRDKDAKQEARTVEEEDDVPMQEAVTNEEENEEENTEEKDFIENDVVRKFQFDHNSSTCFADNMPEIRGENSNVKEETPLIIAPGEGKIL